MDRTDAYFLIGFSVGVVAGFVIGLLAWHAAFS